MAQLSAASDHEPVVAKILSFFPHVCVSEEPLWMTLDPEIQEERSALAENARDEAEGRMDPIEFRGDVVPPDGPPLAWVSLWDGLYVNRYGEHVPAVLRQCGYVLWDQSRWAKLGGPEGLISEQWYVIGDLDILGAILTQSTMANILG